MLHILLYPRKGRHENSYEVSFACDLPSYHCQGSIFSLITFSIIRDMWFLRGFFFLLTKLWYILLGHPNASFKSVAILFYIWVRGCLLLEWSRCGRKRRGARPFSLSAAWFCDLFLVSKFYVRFIFGRYKC